MKEKAKKSWLAVGAGMLAGAFALTGVAMLNSGHKKALADEVAASTERVLYFVDAGRRYQTGGNNGHDGSKIVDGRGNVWGGPNAVDSPFMNAYGLKYAKTDGANILNSVSEKPYFTEAKAGEIEALSQIDSTDTYAWGYVLGNSATGEPITTGFDGGCWRIGLTDCFDLGSETARYTIPGEGDTLDGSDNGSSTPASLMYKFEIPEGTGPVKIYFGTSVFRGDDGEKFTAKTFDVTVNPKGEGTNTTTLTGVVAPKKASNVYNFGDKTFTAVSESYASTEKNVVTIEFGSNGVASAVSWILVTTANYALDYTLAAPIVKNSDTTTVKAYPFCENDAVDVTLGEGAMDTVNAAADYSYVTIPVEKNGLTCNVRALVVPNDAKADLSIENNKISDGKTTVIGKWVSDAHQGGKEVTLLKGRTTIATAMVLGGNHADKGLLLSVPNAESNKLANFTSGSMYCFGGYNPSNAAASGWQNNAIGSDTDGAQDRVDLQVQVKFDPDTAARDNAKGKDLFEVGKATLGEDGVITYVVEVYEATNLETLLFKVTHTIKINNFSGNTYKVRFGFDSQGSSLGAMTLLQYEFNVTFDSQEGSAVAAAKVGNDGKLTKPDDPTKENFDFAGWFTDANCTDGNEFNFTDDVITENTTLYAKWTAKQGGGEDPQPTTYTVTFDSKGGSAVASATTDADGKVQKPTDPTKDNFDFDGWYKDEDCTQAFNFETDVITEDTTLYAKWTAKQGGGEDPQPTTKYTVTFNYSDGRDDTTVQVAEGGKVEKPTDPTRDGYTFEGWYKDMFCEQPFDFETETITDDITLYAKWTQDGDGPVTPTSATITYHLDGGTNHADNPETITAEDGDVELKAPTKAGYTFEGWYTNALFAGTPLDKISMNEADNGVIELWAKWTENAGGGEEETPKKKGCKSSISASLAIVGGMLAAGTVAIVAKKRKNDK